MTKMTILQLCAMAAVAATSGICAYAQESSTAPVEMKPRVVLQVADHETTGPDDATVVSTVQTDRGLSVTLSTGLQYIDLREGVSSQTLGMGDIGFVHYKGTLTETGKEFDNSRTWRVVPQPARIGIGEGKFVKGFEKGVMGMRIGGRRLITVPYSLGYGTRGIPPAIPAYSDLNFEVDLERMTRLGDDITSIGLAAQGIYLDPTPQQTH